MKISEMIRSGRAAEKREAQHRDPLKVSEQLYKAENAMYDLRGRGGFRDAWSWLGEMLSDATGFSGSFYRDKELTKLKDRLYKLDAEIGSAASAMNAAARRIKKEHAANEKKKRSQ